jgi:hypothetical protein
MAVARDFIDGTSLVEASAMARQALRTSTGVSKAGWMIVAFAAGVALAIAALLLCDQDLEPARQVASHPPSTRRGTGTYWTSARAGTWGCRWTSS